MPASNTHVSVSAAAQPLVDALIRDAESLRLECERGPAGAMLVDAGRKAVGGLTAGLRIAEISLAGLGHVSLVPAALLEHWPWQVVVTSRDPMLACIASQMAGWRLRDTESGFDAIGSGPARALVAKEKEFEATGYADRASRSCLILETEAWPDDAVVSRIAADCGLQPEALTLIIVPTQSLCGTVQIAARTLSTALLKMESAGFDVTRVVDAAGSAPLPPAGGSARVAMGRTNDALLYGGLVHLFIDGDESLAKDIAQALPSCNSRSYGKPFLEVFEEAGGFYDIDPALFAPAKVIVTSLESGLSAHAGRYDPAMLDRSFGKPA